MSSVRPIFTAIEQDEPEALREHLDDPPELFALHDLDATVLANITRLSPECLDVLFESERIPGYLKSIWTSRLDSEFGELDDSVAEHLIDRNFYGFSVDNPQSTGVLVEQGRFDLIAQLFQQRSPKSNIIFQSGQEDQTVLYDYYAAEYDVGSDEINFFINMAFRHLNPYALNHAFRVSPEDEAHDSVIDIMQGKDAFQMIVNEQQAQSDPGAFFKALRDHIQFQGDELYTMLDSISLDRPSIFLAALRAFRDDEQPELTGDEADEFMDRLHDGENQRHGQIAVELYRHGAEPINRKRTTLDLLNENDVETWTDLFEYIDYPEGPPGRLHERDKLVGRCASNPDYLLPFDGRAGLNRDQRLGLVDDVLTCINEKGGYLADQKTTEYRLVGLTRTLNQLPGDQLNQLFNEHFETFAEAQGPTAYKTLPLKALIKAGAQPDQEQTNRLFETALQGVVSYRLTDVLLERNFRPGIEVLKRIELDEEAWGFIEDRLPRRARQFLQQAPDEMRSKLVG